MQSFEDDTRLAKAADGRYAESRLALIATN
jgi:hypothetical protein